MTALVLWLVRLIVAFLIVRLIVRGVYSALGHRQPSGPSRHVPERLGGTLVRDPHCGTFIPESRALVLGRGSGTLHFCSAACRDAWTAAHHGARAKV